MSSYTPGVNTLACPVSKSRPRPGAEDAQPRDGGSCTSSHWRDVCICLLTLLSEESGPGSDISTPTRDTNHSNIANCASGPDNASSLRITGLCIECPRPRHRLDRRSTIRFRFLHHCERLRAFPFRDASHNGNGNHSWTLTRRTTQAQPSPSKDNPIDTLAKLYPFRVRLRRLCTFTSSRAWKRLKMADQPP